MKRCIIGADHSSTIVSKVKETFGSDNPQTGCSYIAKDGTFINIYPKLDVHEDLCEWIEDTLNIQLEYRDEEYCIRKFGWIRLRIDPNMLVIELPAESPDRMQWYSLQDWLEFAEGQNRSRRLYLDVCDGSDTCVPYNFGSEYFAEDIMKVCKRYYSSGKLYASNFIKKRSKYT